MFAFFNHPVLVKQLRTIKARDTISWLQNAGSIPFATLSSLSRSLSESMSDHPQLKSEQMHL